MNIEDFETDMNAFTFKNHQEFITYFEHLLKKGWKVQDVREYLEIQKQEINKSLKRYAKLVKSYRMLCPDCNKKMFIYPVNVDRKTMTGDPTDRSVWFCRNTKCLNTIYNKEPLEELMKKGGK